MKFKKIMLLTLLILTLYIGSVSAANDTAVEPALEGIDDSSQVEISNADDSKVLSVEDKNSPDMENKLSSGVVRQFNGTTFSQLQTEINNASSGDTIVLNNDIINDGESYITIKKKICFEGNNHTIDGQGKQILYLYSADGSIFNNITFVNSDSSNGIRLSSMNLTVSSCTFKSSEQYSYSRLWLASGSATVINCTFMGLKSYGICSQCDNFSVMYCNFINNYATTVYTNVCKYVNIAHCRFINNTNNAWSGICNIHNNNKDDKFVQMFNCTFINNTMSGGNAVALFTSLVNPIVSNCTFINNIGFNDGGAIYISSVSNMSISNCTIINNAASDGGAIYISPTSNVTIFNSTFKNNMASSEGGAIYVDNNYAGIEKESFVNITNSIFLNNRGSNGESMYMYNPFILNNNTIDKPVYLVGIGAKYFPVTVTIFNNSTVTVPIFKSIEINVTAQINDPFYHFTLGDNINLIISDNSQVSTRSPSHIFQHVGNFTITIADENFANWTVNGATVNVISGDFGILQQLINDANDGDIINLTRDYTFTEGLDQLITINKDITINGNGHIIDACGKTNIFQINDVEVTLNNITFLKSADKTIVLGGSRNMVANISNCNFINSTGKYDIYHSGIDGSVYFHNNTMKKLIRFCNEILSKVYVTVESNSTIFLPFNSSVNIKISFRDDNYNSIESGRYEFANLLLDDGTVIKTQPLSSNQLYANAKCIFTEVRNYTLSAKSIFLKNMAVFTACADVRKGDFYLLQELINNASDGDVINLTRDYVYFTGVDSQYVTINKQNLTINGNGHIINAKSRTGIFQINSNGVLIKNITFTNSTSWVVELRGANNTIDYCDFINITSGSAVIGVYGSNGCISNCKFSNTSITTAQDINLYSGSSCYLNNNTIYGIIIASGHILSKTTVTILNNSTVYNSNLIKTQLFALINDDNNNKIVGSSLVRYFVLENGNTIRTSYTTQSGIYSAQYLFSDYGDYIISSRNTNDLLDNVTIYKGTVVIREYANISVSTSPIIYGENATFIINISDTARGEILLSVGQHKYNIKLNDTYTGLISYDVAGLAAGDYEVSVNYTSEYLSGEVVAYTTLHVEKAEFELSVSVIEGNASIPTVFNVTAPVDFDGNVSINIAGETEIIPIANGKGSIGIIISHGYFTGFIEAQNSTLYNNTGIICEVHIRDNPDLSVVCDTIIYPENATIVIKLVDEARGFVMLSVGKFNTTIALNDSFRGIINYNMPDLLPGTYNVEVNYTGSGYFTESVAKSTLTVSKAEFELNVTVDLGDSSVPTRFNVECPEDFDGYVIVEVNDNTYFVSLNHGKGSVDINLPHGDYTALIKSINSKLYNDTGAVRNLHIMDNPKMTVECEEIVYGVNATITIRLLDDVRGQIILSVGNYNATIELNDSFTGVINHIVPNLVPDTYEVKVNYTGSDLYIPSIICKTLTVNRAQFDIGVSVVEGNGTIPTQFSITVPGDFDGNVSLSIANKTYQITNNSINVNLAHGTYVGVIKAENSTLYESGDKTVTVRIKDNPNLSVECGAITYGEDGTIIIKLLESVRGSVILNVGKYNATIDLTDDFTGIITHNVANLVPGTYEVKVNYTGSDYYIQSIVNTTLTVSKAKFDIGIGVVEGNGSIPTKFSVITPKDFDGYVSLTINSNTYLIPVTGGSGSLNLTIAHGDYAGVIKAENSRLYNNSENSFNVHIMDSAKISIHCEPITFGENATVIIIMPNDARGKVILTVHDYTATINLNESFTGTITQIIPNLTPATYVVKVNYTGSDYYNSNVIHSTLKVNKASVNLITDIVKGNSSVLTKIGVKVPANFNGNVNVKINDETYNIPIINNAGSINVNLTPGNYTLEFIAFNSANYSDTNVREKISIVAPLSEDIFEIPLNISEGNVSFEINTLPGNANGYFMVIVNGLAEQSVSVVNGSTTPVNLNLTSGKYNLTMIYADKGDYGVVFKSTNITVKSLIPVITIVDNNDVSVKYSGKAVYSVHILSDGVDINDGENVTITFNGQKTVVKTIKGYANLDLNTAVAVGKYTISAEYKDKKVSNTVSVLNIINANNLKTLKKSKKVTKVKISLAQVDGKYLSGKTIVLKIKGKKIASAKTNSKGVATLKIKKKALKKFKKGQYTATVIYGLDSVNKKIKIKK